MTAWRSMKKILTTIREAFATEDAELNSVRKRRYVFIVLGGVLCVIFWEYLVVAYLYVFLFILFLVAYCVYAASSLLGWLGVF